MDTIWHDGSEEPDYTKSFIYVLSDKRADIFIGQEALHYYNALKLLLKDKGMSITHWCYLEDILPKD